MTEINLFPALNALADDVVFLAWNPASSSTVQVSVGQLKSYVGAGSGGGEEPPDVPTGSTYTLTYQSNGDDNGLFYWLGSAGKTATWTNPATSGKIIATQSSVSSNNLQFGAAGCCDRNNEVAHSAGGSQDWWQWDLGNARLTPTRYVYRSRRDYDGYHLSNWRVQGRILETDEWTDLDTQNSNNSTQGIGLYFSRSLDGITTGYRFLRFQNLVGGYLTGSMVEFYGDLYIPAIQ
jgi:hypothetical protein